MQSKVCMPMPREQCKLSKLLKKVGQRMFWARSEEDLSNQKVLGRGHNAFFFPMKHYSDSLSHNTLIPVKVTPGHITGDMGQMEG